MKPGRSFRQRTPSHSRRLSREYATIQVRHRTSPRPHSALFRRDSHLNPGLRAMTRFTTSCSKLRRLVTHNCEEILEAAAEHEQDDNSIRRNSYSHLRGQAGERRNRLKSHV